ncbi:MAG: hypothetical protein RL748_4131 [Pseudomonadota bacterium]
MTIPIASPAGSAPAAAEQSGIKPGQFQQVEFGPIKLLHATPMQVGEGPLWHPAQQVLYWVDIAGRALHQFDPASGQHQQWAMPSEPACLAWCADGLIVAQRSGFCHFNSHTGTLTDIAAAPYEQSKIRCNDGRCDAAGRFWVGTIYEPRDLPNAELLCLERGQLRQVRHGGSTVSNGLAFSIDQGTMFQADTTSHQIRRHRFDTASGTLGPAQLLRQYSTVKDQSYIGRPDGAAVDSEGAYWSAMFEGGRILRLSPDGEILQTLLLPVRCPTMIAFGGADLKTLYITSASQNRSNEELAQYPWSGCVLSVSVSVAGRAEFAYQS